MLTSFYRVILTMLLLENIVIIGFLKASALKIIDLIEIICKKSLKNVYYTLIYCNLRGATNKFLRKHYNK